MGRIVEVSGSLRIGKIRREPGSGGIVIIDRSLSVRAMMLTMGAKVTIVTLLGYLPLLNNSPMPALFKHNAARLDGEGNTPPMRRRASAAGPQTWAT